MRLLHSKTLERDLTQHIQGQVRFSAADRAMYAYDASVYRVIPIGVVIPKTLDDVVRGVEICRAYDVPIYGRGCGTSLADNAATAASPSISPNTCTTSISTLSARLHMSYRA